MKNKGKSSKKKKRKNKKNTDNYTFSIIEVVIFMFISIIFGFVVGYIVTYSSSSLKSIREYPELKEIVDTYISVKKSYYKEIDDRKFSDAAIKGMIDYLDDPNTVFLDNESTDDFNASVSGSYVGIGAVIFYGKGKNIIEEVNENGPADKAGLKAGDVIISINGYNCYDVPTDEIQKYFGGEVGSKIKIKVDREGKERTFIVTKDIIDVKNISSNIYNLDNNKKVGYLKINMFSKNIYSQFKSELDYLENDNINNLVIDLRKNPGGHLSETRKILNLFFKKNTTLYKIDNGKKITDFKDNTSEYRTMPVYLLVDSSSASSSEVFMSCFRNNYSKVYIVGSNTYGKGTVQKTQSLLSGTSIKYTTERWLTSDGKSIDGIGIKPDYEVEYNIDESSGVDSQLQFVFDKIKES